MSIKKKKKSSVTTSSISTSGRSSSMPNIKVPTALSDKLSVTGDNAMSPTNTIPSNRKPPKSTCKTSYASMLSENQFKPIFNDMQSSVYFKGTPPTKDGHEKQCSRLLQSEEEHKSFCAFSGSQPKSDEYPQGDDESLEKQRSGGYVANPLDKQRQRQYERRRNKVIHRASISLGSRFRGGSEARDLSDIFVYHVASDSTVGDIKTHLKQQDIEIKKHIQYIQHIIYLFDILCVVCIVCVFYFFNKSD